MPTHIPINVQKKYQIKIHSCKKDTLVDFYLNDEQLKLVQEIATATQLASQSECEPTVFVTEVKQIKAEQPNN